LSASRTPIPLARSCLLRDRAPTGADPASRPGPAFCSRRPRICAQRRRPPPSGQSRNRRNAALTLGKKLILRVYRFLAPHARCAIPRRRRMRPLPTTARSGSSSCLRPTGKPGRPTEARNKRIFDLWLACHTQEEIAKTVGCDQDTVSEVLRNSAELPKSVRPLADHLVDFDPPIYNVWKFKRLLADFP